MDVDKTTRVAQEHSYVDQMPRLAEEILREELQREFDANIVSSVRLKGSNLESKQTDVPWSVRCQDRNNVTSSNVTPSVGLMFRKPDSVQDKRKVPNADFDGDAINCTIPQSRGEELHAKIEKEALSLIDNYGKALFVKTYLLHCATSDEYVVHPDEFFGFAQSTKDEDMLEEEYHRDLKTFHLNFLKKHMNDIPAKRWAQIFSKMWQYDISVEAFKELNFSDAIISEIVTCKNKY